MPYRVNSSDQHTANGLVLDLDSEDHSINHPVHHITESPSSPAFIPKLLADKIVYFKRLNLNSIVRNELDVLRHAVEDEMDSNSSNSSDHTNSIVIERQGGLANKFVLSLLLTWYMFSALTLYTNKYIVTTRKTDPTLVGTFQMIVTSLCGFAQLRRSTWKRGAGGLTSSFNHNIHRYTSLIFVRNMFVIGFMRLFSIVLGLMALKQSSVSFVETIKSSSPLFTVFVSQFILGEITGFYTKCSLFPIMLGLALCSSFELNFSFFGFMAAILTNLTECLQCVFSKLLLCSDHFKFTPLEVQFFSSASSVLVLVPISYLSVDFSSQNYGFFTLFWCVLNGISFHLQTLLAFTLMSYISPVTYSVCNTVKRAILIWFSVYIFKNQVGYMSAVGTVIVILGVFLYNHAKNIDKRPPTNSSKDTV